MCILRRQKNNLFLHNDGGNGKIRGIGRERSRKKWERECRPIGEEKKKRKRKRKMEKILDVISKEMKKAFTVAGYDGELGKVTLSNRPDLCEYQCNGAMAGAKRYKKAPIKIAQDVVEALGESTVFSEVNAVNPGFLNLRLKEEFVKEYLEGMRQEEKFGLEKPAHPKKIMIDYGGPNVAKPLHVGGRKV